VARGRKKGEGQEGPAAWIVTFADLMSLLLTFFVLLLSFSTMEEKKVKEALSSLRGALGVLPKSDQPISRPVPRLSMPKPVRKEQTKAKIGKLRQEIRSKGLEKQVNVSEKDRGIVNIRLPASLLFRSGSADLLESSYPILQEVAELLDHYVEFYDPDFRIEGHTDDVPISVELQSVFPSNWELSTARALSCMWFFTRQADLDEQRFGVAGFGSNKPLYRPLELPGNRRRNRRVEIVVIPKKNIEEAESSDSSPGGQGMDHQLMPSDDVPGFPEPM